MCIKKMSKEKININENWSSICLVDSFFWIKKSEVDWNWCRNLTRSYVTLKYIRKSQLKLSNRLWFCGSLSSDHTYPSTRHCAAIISSFNADTRFSDTHSHRWISAQIQSLFISIIYFARPNNNFFLIRSNQNLKSGKWIVISPLTFLFPYYFKNTHIN